MVYYMRFAPCRISALMALTRELIRQAHITASTRITEPVKPRNETNHLGMTT